MNQTAWVGMGREPDPGRSAAGKQDFCFDCWNASFNPPACMGCGYHPRSGAACTKDPSFECQQEV